MRKKSPSPKLCAMSAGRGRRAVAKEVPKEGASAKEAPSPGRAPAKRVRPNEAETAAEDASKEAADLEDATETSHQLPQGLLQRRLNKSNDTIQQLEKEKAVMQKRMDELQKKVEEEAKAGKLAKLVEAASPGAVVQVSRQVHS